MSVCVCESHVTRERCRGGGELIIPKEKSRKYSKLSRYYYYSYCSASAQQERLAETDLAVVTEPSTQQK